MPRSLLRGDYSLVMAIESSSRPNSWYRVLTDRQTGLLSCDCPPWVFNRQSDEQGNRACQHTIVTSRLTATNQTAIQGNRSTSPSMSLTTSPLLAATQEQWPGLRGTWSIEERDANIGAKPYHFVLLRLAMGNGGMATGVVAFANAHRHNEMEMIPGVAGWAGYAIAAEVARLGGFPMAGQPPEHFRIDRRPTTGRAQRERPVMPQATPTVPHIGLADILRVGDIIQPGTNPKVVAENTLKLFLGETLYGQLEQRGFLDVSSVHYPREQRVYRLRRDHYKEQERRVRVFRQTRYEHDFCIVRGQTVPEADFYLTNFLMFLSDERIALSVVQPHNIFPPNSDGTERETIPAVWRPRATAIIA